MQGQQRYVQLHYRSPGHAPIARGCNASLLAFLQDVPNLAESRGRSFREIRVDADLDAKKASWQRKVQLIGTIFESSARL